jgi:hypothetical protein
MKKNTSPKEIETKGTKNPRSSAQRRLDFLVAELRDQLRYRWRTALRDALPAASDDVMSERFYESVRDLAAVSAKMLHYATEARGLVGANVRREDEARGLLSYMPENRAWRAIALVAGAFRDAGDEFDVLCSSAGSVLTRDGVPVSVDYQRLAADALAALDEERDKR